MFALRFEPFKLHSCGTIHSLTIFESLIDMKTITQRKSSLKHRFQQSKARCRILHCDDLYRNGDDGEKERESKQKNAGINYA